MQPLEKKPKEKNNYIDESVDASFSESQIEELLAQIVR